MRFEGRRTPVKEIAPPLHTYANSLPGNRYAGNAPPCPIREYYKHTTSQVSTIVVRALPYRLDGSRLVGSPTTPSTGTLPPETRPCFQDKSVN
jgi:hypothetical protein